MRDAPIGRRYKETGLPHSPRTRWMALTLPFKGTAHSKKRWGPWPPLDQCFFRVLPLNGLSPRLFAFFFERELKKYNFYFYYAVPLTIIDIGTRKMVAKTSSGWIVVVARFKMRSISRGAGCWTPHYSTKTTWRQSLDTPLFHEKHVAPVAGHPTIPLFLNKLKTNKKHSIEANLLKKRHDQNNTKKSVRTVFKIWKF